MSRVEEREKKKTNKTEARKTIYDPVKSPYSFISTFGNQFAGSLEREREHVHSPKRAENKKKQTVPTDHR